MATILKKICFNFFLFFFFTLTACSDTQPKLRPLPSGAIILAFGDSLTYGTGATPDTSYPAILEKLTGFKVINAGVPGEETRDSLVRITKELDNNVPQLVIVFLGGNDIIRKRPFIEIKENLRKIVKTIQRSGAQVVLIGVPAFTLSLDVPDFYQELGEELDIPVNIVSMPTLFRIREYKSDYIHFNADGYKALAEDIAKFLQKQGAITSKSE